MIWRILKSPFVTGPLFALLMAVVSLTYLTPDHQFFVAVGVRSCSSLSGGMTNGGRAAF
ncbi:hypothetical protein RAA17_18605 [Komagataeibacter rhaeticus]|nr:hypothetical protein [Komagataeibacter rhaeticus]